MSPNRVAFFSSKANREEKVLEMYTIHIKYIDTNPLQEYFYPE